MVFLTDTVIIKLDLNNVIRNKKHMTVYTSVKETAKLMQLPGQPLPSESMLLSAVGGMMETLH